MDVLYALVYPLVQEASNPVCLILKVKKRLKFVFILCIDPPYTFFFLDIEATYIHVYCIDEICSMLTRLCSQEVGTRSFSYR